MGETVHANGEVNAYKILDGKLEVKKRLGRPRRE
jgi:hypothetical protein